MLTPLATRMRHRQNRLAAINALVERVLLPVRMSSAWVIYLGGSIRVTLSQALATLQDMCRVECDCQTGRGAEWTLPDSSCNRPSA